MTQINRGLPVEEIRKVIVRENSEWLVQIHETNRIALLNDHKYLSPFLRKTVVELLYKAADNLPAGYKLLIVTAYCPLWMQKELWNQRLRQMAKAHPFKMVFQYKQWRKEASRYTSPPGGSSHQSGGAVDLTVLDNRGNRLDMGTTFTDYGKKVHTENDLITEIQRQNRKILYDTMTKAGFVNYPLEWWHYCYGDRMWAAYTSKTECFYGAIDEKSERQYIDLFTPEERRVYAERVWNLIVKTYEEYGNSEDGNLYGANIDNLVETPGVWKLVKRDDEIIAGVIFRKFKGNKLRLVFHDCTRSGKDALKEVFLNEFKEGRCWGECSGHLERILREHNAPIISNTKALEILEKEIKHLDPDGMHYEREVFPGTIKREMLFGRVEI